MTPSTWLLTYAVHSTILLGSVWLVTRSAFARLDPLREILWKTALAGGLLTATLQLLVGVEPIGVLLTLAVASPENEDAPLPAEAGEPPDPETATSIAHSLDWASLAEDEGFNSSPPALPGKNVAQDGSGPKPLSAGSHDGIYPSSSQEGEPGSPVSRKSSTSPIRRNPAGTGMAVTSGTAEKRPPLDWRRLATPVSAAACVIGLALFCLNRLRLRRGLAARRSITDPRLQASLLRLRRAALYRRPVRLTASDRVPVPVALGVLRPEICLPTRALTELDPSQQEAVLAHELAHLKRRDPAWLLLAQVVESLFFFQPLNRLARRGLQEAAEFACDAGAAGKAGRSITLARCLAEVAGWTAAASPRTAFSSLAATTENRSFLARRIERLLENRGPGQREVPRLWRLALSAGLVILLAAVAPGVTTETNRNLPADSSLHNAIKDRDSTDGPASRLRGQDQNPDASSPPVREDCLDLLNALDSLDGETAELEQAAEALREAMLRLPDAAPYAALLDRLDGKIRDLSRKRQAIEEAVPGLRNLAQHSTVPDAHRPGSSKSQIEPVDEQD